MQKRLASLFIECLKESSGEQATLKLSTNLVFVGEVVVLSPVDLTNAMSYVLFTKETQSFLVIELNLKASMSSGKSSVAIR